MKVETAFIVVNEKRSFKIVLIPEDEKEATFLKEATNINDVDLRFRQLPIAKTECIGSIHQEAEGGT